MQISPPEISLSCRVARTTVFDLTVWFFWYKVCWQHYSNRTCESPPFIRCSFQRHLSSSVTGHFATFNTILFTKGGFFRMKKHKSRFRFRPGLRWGSYDVSAWAPSPLGREIPPSHSPFPLFPLNAFGVSMSGPLFLKYDHVATPVSCLWRQQHVSNFVISKGRNVSAPRH